MAPYSLPVSQQIADFNVLPLASVSRFPEQNQFRTIEAYVALNVHNWELSFGQQSLLWSPDFGGSLLLSNNAQPMPMLRMARVVPYPIPGALAWLGKIRNTIFIGRLGGYNYIRGPYPTFQPLFGNAFQNINPLPYTWGDKLALKMTPNLEIGVGLSVVWAGYSRPATMTSWWHTFSTQGNAQPLTPESATPDLTFLTGCQSLEIGRFFMPMAWPMTNRTLFAILDSLPGIPVSIFPSCRCCLTLTFASRQSIPTSRPTRERTLLL